MSPAEIRFVLDFRGQRLDGSLMSPQDLDALRQRYVNLWREAVAAFGPNSESAALNAMFCERIDELRGQARSPRGQALRGLLAAVAAPDGDLVSKYKRLREALMDWYSQLHQEAVAADKRAPMVGNAEPETPVEQAALSQVLSEQVRVLNEITRPAVANLTQRLAALTQRGPATDLMARRQQREDIQALIYGPTGSAAAKAPQDGLPTCLADALRARLGLERQDELMGGSLIPDKQREVLMKAMEANVAAAVTAAKQAVVNDARVGLQDAQRRIAALPRITDKVERLKNDVLIREELQAIGGEVISRERMRQLMGGGEGDGADAGNFLGMSLAVSKEDAELYAIFKEAQRVLLPYLNRPESEAIVLGNLEDALNPDRASRP